MNPSPQTAPVSPHWHESPTSSASVSTHVSEVAPLPSHSAPPQEHVSASQANPFEASHATSAPSAPHLQVSSSQAKPLPSHASLPPHSQVPELQVYPSSQAGSHGTENREFVCLQRFSLPIFCKIYLERIFVTTD